MMTKVAEAKEIPDGRGKIVRVGGKRIAIFRVGADFYAIDNFCLHRGGPLGEGELNGYSLVCPWHGWSYDIRTGSFEIIPALKVRSYVAKQVGEHVFVEIETEASAASDKP